ncbi:MAG: SEC-C metal-binding domain-containing protein [Desulfocucumaceae bacterium]
MNKNIDSETYNRLVEVLARAKAAGEEMRQKQEAKLWADIKVPLSLYDALSSLTKDELTQIRQNLGIKKVSALKKQDLIAELQRRIPEGVEEVLLRFDSDRYSLAKSMAGNGGFTVYRRLETDQVEYLRARGIIFPGASGGRKMLVMPQEILEEFKKINGVDLQRRVRRNTELIRLTQGLLYYYGTLSFNQLKEMLQKHTGEKIDVVQYIDLMHDAACYYREVRGVSSGYSNIRVWDPERVKKEQEARPDIDFYPFTREQLFSAGEPGFVDRNSAYKDFVDFLLKNYEISRDEADSITEECVYATRIGESLQDIVKFLQTRLEIATFDILQEFSDQLTHFMNNTRQWFLKGYTPEELLPREKMHSKGKGTHLRAGMSPIEVPADRAEVIDIRTRQKVGRNDPCPCGSGKKFKKCCGR